MTRRQRIAQIYLGLIGGGTLFVLANVMAHDARIGYAEAGMLEAIRRMPQSVRRMDLAISAAPPDILIALGTVGAAALGLWVWQLSKGTERRGEEHGSARWGRPADIAGLTNRRRPERNLLLTRSESLSLDRLSKQQHQRNLNVLCLGASGSGKSRFFIMPNIMNAQSSMLVTDPKGELLQETGIHLIEAGYTIRVLNLVDFGTSDQFNAFAYLRPGHEPEDIELMVRNIMSNTDGDKKLTAGGDPFWEKAEAALLNALCAFVAASFPDHERHLGTVVDLLGQMEATEDRDRTEVDELFAQAELMLPELVGRPEAELMAYAVGNYRIYRQAAAKTASSIIVSAGVRLAPLLIPSVRRLVSNDTLALDSVGFEKTALFMVISDTDKQFNWLASLVFTMFFQRSVFLADQEPGRRLPIPVQCWMDEFANIGKIPDFDILAATLRSRGLSFAVVVQNIAQGQSLYREGWKAIVGNCDSILFLGSADPETRKYISEALGKQTIQTTDTSSTKGRNGSSSRSRKTIGRELLTPDEVGRLPGDMAILIIRGLSPFRSRKLNPVASGTVYSHQPATGDVNW